MTEPPFRQAVAALAARFAAQLVEAIQSATVGEIEAIAGGASSRAQASNGSAAGRGGDTAPHAPPKRGRGRPRKIDLTATVADIVDHVKAHPGTSGEAARAALKLPTATWNPSVRHALETNQLRKRGERRGTRYWPA